MANEKLYFQVGINKSKDFDKIKKEVETLAEICDKGITINGATLDKSLSQSISDVKKAVDDLKDSIGTGKPLSVLSKKSEKAAESIDKLSKSMASFVQNTGRAISENSKIQEFVNNLGNIIRAVNKDLQALQNPKAFKGFAKQMQDSAKSITKAEIELAKLEALRKKMVSQSAAAQRLGLDTTDIDNAIRKIEIIKDGLKEIKNGGGYNSAGLTTSKYMASAPVQIKLMESKQSLSDISAKTREIERLNMQAARANAIFSRMATENAKVGNIFRNSIPEIDAFRRALTAIGGIYVIRQLLSDIIRVRGEFEQMEVAVTSLIGSTEKAGEVIADLKGFARISPLTIKDLMEATQTMIGFGVEVQKIPRFIRALGDVSIGNSERFKALTLAFSQMTAAGRLMGQDNLQFINAGFNPLMYIAEKTGKTMKELRDEMQRGAISTKMVEQAFLEATEAGGKFYKMSEKTAQTVAGQMNKLKDSIYRSLNKFGQDNEQVLMDGIHNIQILVDNYERVGRVLMGMVISYGTYRTAVLLATAAEEGYTFVTGLTRLRLLATQKAQALLNATMLNNPYVAAASALGLLLGILYATADTTSSAELAQRSFNDALNQAAEEQKNYNQETENAISLASSDATATDKRREALNLLIQRYPSIIQKYIDEEGHLRNIAQLKRDIAILDSNNVVSDLNKRRDDSGKYASAISRYRNAKANGGEASPEDKRLYSEAVSLYLKETGKSRFGNVDPIKIQEYFEQQSKLFGKQAQRQATQNATKRFQDTITGMTDGQLQALQNTLKRVKGKKSVILKAYQDLANVTLNADDIKNLMTYTSGIIGARKGAIRGKAQIEADKKLAQEQLDALSIAEAQGKKGEELRKKILGYTKELEAYNASKSAKADEKEGNKAKLVGESIEKLTGEQMKQAITLQRQQVDMLLSTREAEIGAMEESTRRSLAQIEFDRDKKLEAIKREYEDLKMTRIENAKKLWDADINNKGVNFYESQAYKTAASENSYTDAEISNRAAKENEAIKVYERSLRDLKMKEFQDLYDYIKKYGSIQAQKVAITREYDMKISKAQEAIQKASLQAEKERLIAELDMKELSQNIDWETIFNNLDKASTEAIEKLRDKLRKLLENGEISPENAAVISERLLATENEISKRTNIWASLIPALQERLRLVNQVKATELEITNQKEKQAEKEKEVFDVLNSIGGIGSQSQLASYADKLKGGDIQSVADALGIKEGSEEWTKLNVAMENYRKSLERVTVSQEKLDTLNDMLKGKQGLFGGLRSIMESAIKSGGGGFAGILSVVNQNVQSMSDFVDKIGLGDTEFGEAVHDFSQGVSGFNGAITSLASGDIFGAINGVLDGIAGFGRGFTTLFAGNGNVDEMEAEIAELAQSNELLAKSIESLSKSINDSDKTNAQSEEAYKRALAAEKEWEANQRKAIGDRASEWSNGGHGFLGLSGKSSFNYFVNERGRDWSGWKDFNNVLSQNGYKKQVYSAQDLWSLTPEMMKLLRDYAPAAWRELLSTDGESNPSDLINEYIENAGKIDELTSALNEKLTGYSWDSFKGSYVDLLKDLDSTNQDFADNLEDMLTNAILNSLVNEMYKERIKALYKMIADAASDESEGGSNFTKSELSAIRAYNEQLATDLINLRDNLVSSGVIKETEKNSRKSSSSSSIKGITEQDAGLGLSYMNSIRADISLLRGITEKYTTDMFNLVTLSNVSLKNIANHTAAIMMSNDAIMRSNEIVAQKISALDDKVNGLKNNTWQIPVK